MINRNQVRLSKLALGLAIALAAAPAFAQNTSSAVGGRVSDASGQPVAGAQVTIVHSESGTASQAVTGADGRYLSRGLRTGGPYTITITKDGKTETRSGVYLALAETGNVDATLGTAATTLDTVQVVGTAGVFSPTAMGTTTNVSRADIENLPSSTRNIQDYIRLDPRITQVSKADGAISAGGQNSRYNSIKIDGVGAGDPFGLESNNLPTERQPVSVDAIEAINIAVADYDVTIAGGVGAVVNAVTKSGTNEFHGSLYYAFRDKSWVREELRGVNFTGFEDETTYGGTFGGPLIKDKLFFFANYEKYVRTSPGVGLGDTPLGTGNISQADVTAVQNAATVWGFDAGTLDPVSADTEIEEKAIKLDWNINDDHRASLRYSETEQVVVRFPELDNNSISLSSFWYALPKTYDSTVVQLFSDWSQNFSTEFKYSNRGYSQERATFSDLPSIRINGYTGNNSIFIGTEQNSHVNLIDTEQDSFYGAANWYVGDHVVKFGFDYETNDIVNFFGRNLNGHYEFANFAAFQAGTPARYIVRVPVPGGNLEEDVPAAYSMSNLALFVQDTWTVTDNLTVTLGARWDKPSFDDQPKRNTYVGGIYGYDNTVVPDTALFQPRFGFNYTFDSERPTQVRGGLGLLQGAAPNVWIAGTYQNTGLNYLEYDLSNPGPIFTDSVDPPYYPATPTPAQCSPTPTLNNCARQNVDFIEEGFELPSVWKANLAFEHELPWDGIVFSAEAVRTLVNKGIFVQRLDLYNAAGDGVTLVGQDGRDLFWNPGTAPNAGTGIATFTGTKFRRPVGVGDSLLVRNTDKGASTQITFGLDRPMKGDWSWSAFYTYTEATEVSPLTSSINNSNWNGQLVFDANEEVAYNSRYAIRDRFTGTVNWQHAFFGDYKTKVGLFYEGRSGRPYSLVFRNDANGDGNSSFVDLFYVPAGPNDVVFSGGAAMEASFFSWLDTHPEIKRYAGRVVPANSMRAGFTHNFDVRISQELPGFFEGHKSSISLDINNIGNLFNKDWGLIEDYGFFTTARVASLSGICKAAGTSPTAPCGADDIGKYVYNWTGAFDQPAIQENNNDKGNTGVSRWSVLATFKYEF
ncbi:MAG: Oar protein [Gammaproteobacteria bacterium RIFCSPHIGHO2_12_FULL_63_22]|nr:MAG: Oar protein [Gammaproteobacteria bacterium RIFCSPHIGHO2_12_FULL_63_22]